MQTQKQRHATYEKDVENGEAKGPAHWTYLKRCENDIQELLIHAGVFSFSESGDRKRRALAENIVRYWTTTEEHFIP